MKEFCLQLARDSRENDWTYWFEESILIGDSGMFPKRLSTNMVDVLDFGEEERHYLGNLIIDDYGLERVQGQ